MVSFRDANNNPPSYKENIKIGSKQLLLQLITTAPIQRSDAMKEKLLNIKGELTIGDNKQNSKNCIKKP